MQALGLIEVTETFPAVLNAFATIPRHNAAMGTQIALFDLAEKRMAWVDQRQALLAQNIANANTPHYQARDATPFAQALAQVAPEMVRTNAMHLTGPVGKLGRDARQRAQERGIDGNAVSMEEQLTKVADTEGTHALVTNLYHKYMGLFRTALGK